MHFLPEINNICRVRIQQKRNKTPISYGSSYAD